MYRDFAYSDMDRIESIIAQSHEGLLKELVAGQSLSGEAKADVGGILRHLLPIGLEASGEYQRSSQTSEVLHDYAFSIALKALKDGRLLIESTGRDRKNLPFSEKAFVLVRGKASVLDYSSLQHLGDNLGAVSELFGLGNQAGAREGIESMAQMVNIFMKDLLILKMTSDSGLSFSGPLVRSSLRENVRNFIFKYGGSASADWVMLSQVSRIPADVNKMQTLQSSAAKLQVNSTTFTTGSDLLNKVAEMINAMQEVLASVAYPDIGISPIALYREVRNDKHSDPEAVIHLPAPSK